MKIPIRIMATRPAAPILFRHVALAVVVPLAAALLAGVVTFIYLASR